MMSEAGSSAFMDDQPLARLWRDMSTAHRHTAYRLDPARKVATMRRVAPTRSFVALVSVSVPAQGPKPVAAGHSRPTRTFPRLTTASDPDLRPARGAPPPGKGRAPR